MRVVARARYRYGHPIVETGARGVNQRSDSRRTGGVSGEGREREMERTPGSGSGERGKEGGGTPGPPGRETQAQAASLGEILYLQGCCQALGAFHGRDKNCKHPGGERTETKSEAAVAETDPTRLQGEPEAPALFKDNREELESEVEDENEIRHGEARPGERRERPAEAAGKLERGGGTHEVGGNEDDRCKACENEEREPDPLEGNRWQDPAEEDNRLSGSKEQLKDDCEDEKEEKGTKAPPGGIPPCERGAVEGTQEEVDEGKLREGAAGKGESREDERREETHSRIDPVPRGGTGNAGSAVQSLGGNHGPTIDGGSPGFQKGSGFCYNPFCGEHAGRKP